MSDKTTEAMTLALEALEKAHIVGGQTLCDAAIAALRDALREASAQAKQSYLKPIQECYGDCPTNPETCLNPCKFEGRPKPLAQHKIEEQTRA